MENEIANLKTDAEFAEDLSRLNTAKMAAVEEEDYDEAKRLKTLIDELKAKRVADKSTHKPISETPVQPLSDVQCEILALTTSLSDNKLGGAYPNQIHSGEEVIEKFINCPYVMLLAPMQSGKTGTYLYVACEMIRRGMVDSVIIMTGCREVVLREQCNQDKQKFIDAYLDHYSTLMNGADLNSLRKRLVKAEVRWGPKLKTTTLQDKTLVIWEESHFAQGKINEPYKWFKENDIYKALSGDFSTIRERGIKILSVSATPFSELINDLKIGNQFRETLEKKGLVYLTPPTQYRGLGDYIANDCVNPNFQLTNKNGEIQGGVHKMNQLLDRFKNKNLYSMIRYKCTRDGHLLKRLAAHCYEVLEYDMESSPSSRYLIAGQDGGPGKMALAPPKPTLVLLKGKCRMGCVVPKAHVGFVFDIVKDSKSDASFQGLAGRMCGTPGDDPFTDNWPEIYINKKNKERADDYTTKFTEGVAPVCEYASNVKKFKNVTSQAEQHGHPFIPIRISDAGEVAELNMPPPISKHRMFTIWLTKQPDDHPIWGRNNNTQIRQIKQLLNDGINKGRVGFRLMCKSHVRNVTVLKDMVRSYESGKHTFKYFDNDNDDYSFKFCHWDDKGIEDWEQDLGARPGDVWITGWTENQDPNVLDETRNNQNIPETTGQEAFVPGEITTEAGNVHETNGALVLHLPKETQNDPQRMLDELKIFVTASVGQRQSSCQISSQYDHKTKEPVGIYLNVAAYGLCELTVTGPRGPTKKKKWVFGPQFDLDKWGTECGVCFKTGSWARGRQRNGYKRLTQISWTPTTTDHL